MFSRKNAIVAAMVVLVTCAAVHGATLEEILSKVEARSKDLKDMQARFEMKMDVMNQSVAASGTMKMVPAQGKFAMDMKMQMMGMEIPTTIVCDGRMMYQRIETGGQVMVNKVDLKQVPGFNPGQMMGMGSQMGGVNALDGNVAQQVEAMKKFMDIKVNEKDATLPGGEQAWVLEGKFKPEYFETMMGKAGTMGANADVLRSQFGGMRIYVGQKSHYMNKMEFLDSDNKSVGSMTLSDVRINEGIAPKEFRFEVPEGAEVRDLTAMMKQQMSRTTSVGARADREAEEKVVDAGPRPLLKAGVKAVAFKVKTLDGREAELTELRGKPVVLFFWATWHPGSIEQLSELQRMIATHGKDVRFMALSLNDMGEEKKVREVLVGHNVNLPAALIGNEVFDAYAIGEVPCWVLIDAEGRVVSSEARPKDLDGLKKQLGDLAAAAADKRTAAATE